MLKSQARTILSALRRFAGNQSGATAIEYALIASGISVAIAAVIGGVGTNVQNMFANVSTALK